MTFRRTEAAVVLVLFALPVTAWAEGRDRPPLTVAELVRTHRGDELFLLADPTAAITAAWRDTEGRPGKDGVRRAPAGGYELTNRVIVRAADGRAVPAALGARPNVSLERTPYASQHWIVTTPSVQSAIQTARDLASSPGVLDAYVDMSEPVVLRGPNDPQYPLQWHLNNTDPGDPPYADVNAEPAWALGYSGAGVTIGIVEYGFWKDHPDLVANFNSEASQTITGSSTWWHGTACAGIAAAAANNGEGGVGLAHGAQLSMQRIGSSSQKAAAFGYRNDLNYIKSNSWGPADGIASTMSSIERNAIEDAIANGRGGLGTIFVWAAGNAGLGDRVDYDAYVSSRYTCAIGAIGNWDFRATYNERGSSMLAVTHSDGNTRSIYTTSHPTLYTSDFGGTSAASPLAAGVVALMLEANPNLTWRDVQHLIINSARMCDPTHLFWTQNAAGHWINYDYGFGALDAAAAVTLAEQWAGVRQEVSFETDLVVVDANVPDGDPVGVTRSISVGDDIRIESVELIINTSGDRIGDLEIVLTSPSGTESVLATYFGDESNDYNDYLFTSLRHWDELSAGEWSLRVADVVSRDVSVWQDFRLRFHGTLRPGDLNGDRRVNAVDISGFVCALIDLECYYSMYPAGDHTLADVNEDGQVDFGDINPFIEVLGL